MSTSATTTVQVLIVEDHNLVRAGLRTLLQELPDVQVVAETGDGHDALRLIEQYQPDVVLMDISVPGLNGLEAAERALKRNPRVRVLFLSMHSNEEYVWQALRVGASGYLLKDADISELAPAIRAVARGESYLSPRVSRHLITDYLRRVGADQSPQDRLTLRQREVLQLIAEGRTTQQIAHILNISVKTVEVHRAQLMERLDIHDVAGLVRYAVQTGLVIAD